MPVTAGRRAFLLPHLYTPGLQLLGCSSEITNSADWPVTAWGCRLPLSCTWGLSCPMFSPPCHPV